MFRRLFALVIVLWALGFVAFAISLPHEPAPRPAARAQAIVVLTGGEGRIAHGLSLLQQSKGQVMLVSGVDGEVLPREFAVEHKVPPALMACCVVLGYDSIDTRSNARETAAFVAARRLGAIRLVTSDWHMRRALWEMHRALPVQVEVAAEPVVTHPSFGILMAEYSKYVARLIWDLAQRARN